LPQVDARERPASEALPWRSAPQTEKHVVVLNRWYDERASYARYFDHRRCQVSYLTTPASEAWLRQALDGCPARLVVTDLADVDAVTRAAYEVERWGGAAVTDVVALAEWDLMTAAVLRERLDVPGSRPKDVFALRDKVAMKRAVAADGIPVPRFAACDDAPALGDLVERSGFPIVFKPRSEATAVGVEIVRSAEQLARLLAERDARAHECEEYVDGRLFHADGLVEDGILRFFKVSEYVNNPLLYLHGTGAGAIIVDDAGLVGRARDLADAVLRALGLRCDAFHLEFFQVPSGELVFLELGARAGGGPIPQLLEDLYGVHVVQQHFRLLVGDPLELDARSLSRIVGGYLMIPEPKGGPWRVQSSPRLTGKLPTLYEEAAPQPGDVLDGTANYLNTCGRYLYRGATTTEVRRDVLRTLEEFLLECEPVNGQ
jgi:biotin carboxylase